MMKPRRYRGRRTREIRFPLGGIGTGCVSLGGVGHLVDWELFHRPAKNTLNGFSHFAVKAVRDRYDGERRNPWNEIECGNHCARSMARYALLPAFSGFRYDLTRGLIGFRPVRRPNNRFRCFWALGTAWGDVVLDRRGCRLRVRAGELTIQRLDVPLPGRDARPTVRLGTRTLPATRDGNEIVLAAPALLRAGRGTALSVR